MFLGQFPMWLRLLIWVLRTLAQAEPPKNGLLEEDKE